MGSAFALPPSANMPATTPAVRGCEACEVTVSVTLCALKSYTCFLVSVRRNGRDYRAAGPQDGHGIEVPNFSTARPGNARQRAAVRDTVAVAIRAARGGKGDKER